MEAQIDYKQLAAEMMGQMVSTTKAITAPTAKYLHGPTGLFNTPGLDRQVFSALSLPNNGLAARLPVRTTNIANPLYALITGRGAPTGEEADEVCDPGQTVGFIYGCQISAVLGRLSLNTPVYDVDRLGLMDRGETVDLQLIGGVSANHQLMPVTGDNQQALNSDMNMAAWLLGLEFHTQLSADIFTGDPANNTAGGGRKYFRGLDLLINTGHLDVPTGTACPAADSKITTFDALITANTTNTIAAFTNMARWVKRRAVLSGLAPATWDIVMRAEAFYELTEIWPCAYATYRCGTLFTEADSRSVDGFRLNEMRDAMRVEGSEYLLIDGQKWPVVIDDSILQTEFVANTTYESNAYFVPRTVVGNIAPTYLETLNYTAQLPQMNRGGKIDYFVSDGGRFLWTSEKQYWCRNMAAKIEPRLVLRTPHLAGRIDGLRYTPTMVLPSPIIGEDGYLNGGVQVRS